LLEIIIFQVKSKVNIEKKRTTPETHRKLDPNENSASDAGNLPGNNEPPNARK